MNTEFQNKIKTILGKEFDAFIASYNNPTIKSIRVNTLKIDTNKLITAMSSNLNINPEVFTSIPWCSTGLYLNSNDITLGKQPYYHAGAYYIQEASAMIPVEILNPIPGDKVLDLCAAPGGKSVQIGVKLEGQGLLVTNDISPKRTKALTKNIQMAGINNAIVTNSTPDQLSKQYPSFFDKILVDAPCSGEGMFKKDKNAEKNWSNNYVLECQSIQRDILKEAIKMLKPGGKLVYSTCTFSPEENEDHIEFISTNFPTMHLDPLEPFASLSNGINGEKVLRAWPHLINGTGHFISSFKKDDSNISSLSPQISNDFYSESFDKFMEDFNSFYNGTIHQIKDNIYFLIDDIKFLKGPRVECMGLHLGSIKNDRFKPSQALATSLKIGMFKNILNLNLSDPLTLKYLKGETLNIDMDKGWVLICLDNMPLGWAKSTGSFLKNQYNPNWRMN